MGWVTDRDPDRSELRWIEKLFRLSGEFLICKNGHIRIAIYIMYPRVKDISKGKPTSRDWYDGFWDYEVDNFQPDGWMPLPEPIQERRSNKG